MIKLGLLGKTLSHSLSPQIHQYIMKELNINGEYNLYEVEEEKLKDIMDWFRANDIKGLNVTIPYKISIMKYIDKLSPEAEKIGSVNTIVFKENHTEGFNTDYFGFKSTLEDFNIEVKNKKVLILGTGGAAASVYQCISDLDAQSIYLASRYAEAVRSTWKTRGAEVITYDEIKDINGDIIINCTPCGMYPNIDFSPVSRNVIEGFSTAMDLIYNPKETLFLMYANELGLKTVNGLYMLAAQAVESEKTWNKIPDNMNIIDDVFGYIGNEFNQ